MGVLGEARKGLVAYDDLGQKLKVAGDILIASLPLWPHVHPDRHIAEGKMAVPVFIS